jgi:ubiquinone/menaquinone biosynthesis C-methylase UbiE
LSDERHSDAYGKADEAAPDAIFTVPHVRTTQLRAAPYCGTLWVASVKGVPMLSESTVYDRHDDEYERCTSDPQRAATAQTWLRDDTLNHWRYERIYRLLLPLIETDPDARWLTVGDGRFGSDARFLKQHGVSAHASDWSPQLLQIAAERGLIDEFSRQNAENLTFDDASFDYVYCRESLHHFPRPFIALHEMFRVARKAVILQEPPDKAGLSKIYSRLRGRLHGFEPVGNYIFRLSRQECEKFLLAMHYRHCAFQSISDDYVAGTEFCPKSRAEQSRSAASG